MSNPYLIKTLLLSGSMKLRKINSSVQNYHNTMPMIIVEFSKDNLRPFFILSAILLLFGTMHSVREPFFSDSIPARAPYLKREEADFSLLSTIGHLCYGVVSCRTPPHPTSITWGLEGRL